MHRRRGRVTEADLRANSGAIWNAFIDLLATTEEYDLSALQRTAHLVFWYESEMQNGGHLQFFSNWDTKRASETVLSLGAIGAPGHAQILKQALDRWTSIARLPPGDNLEYSAVASEMEFNDLDHAFSDQRPDLVQVLERHLSEHEAEYIIRD
jgi:hypothetical protein